MSLKHALYHSNGCKILVVEDNPINQEVAVDLLKMNGMSMTMANNGKEAFQLLEKQ